jgi:NADH:ubiquinone oxidoreductase subunit K
MLPVLVYAARAVHASSAVATALVAVNAFGTMAFDLPAGRIVARLGEHRSTWVAGAMMVLGLVGCLAARSVPLLAASLFVQAGGLAVWSLVRMTHLSRVAGNVIGPFVFVVVAGRSDASAGFAVYLVAVVVGFGWLMLARDRGDGEAVAVGDRVRPLRMVREHRRGFATSGVGAFGIMLLRGSRTAIIPLWAAHLGLGSGSAAGIYAWSSLVDLALFYPAGVISDRWGRRAVAIPCVALLSVGHALVPLAHSATSLFLVAFVLGFGNGLGSGIVMTMGADLTPAVGRASFLAVWRVVSDAGNTAGPLVDSAVVGLLSLALAGPVVGLLGAGATAVLVLGLREPEHLASRPSALRVRGKTSPPAADPDPGSPA